MPMSTTRCLRLLAISAIGLFWLICRGAQAAAQPAEEKVAVNREECRLAGSLLVPDAKAPAPLVLIIAGSGPTDRDGNGPGAINNSLKLLAEGLARSGIATLRYDKRGIGASVVPDLDEAKLTFDQNIDDAEAWLRMLRADQRFSSITVLGHSEGSLVGMVAARRGGADGFISVSGAGERVSEILRHQLAHRLTGELVNKNEEILKALESGTVGTSVPPELLQLYRPSIQPYLVSLFKYSPTVEIAKLEIPVLIIHGTSDVQVTQNNAEKLKTASKQATLLVVQGMDHIMKKPGISMEDRLASYNNSTLPIAPEVIPAIENFVRNLAK